MGGKALVRCLAKELKVTSQMVIQCAGQIYGDDLRRGSDVTEEIVDRIAERIRLFQEVKARSLPKPRNEGRQLPGGRAFVITDVLATRPGALIQHIRLKKEGQTWLLLSILEPASRDGQTVAAVVHWYLPAQATESVAWAIPLSRWNPLYIQTPEYMKSPRGPDWNATLQDTPKGGPETAAALPSAHGSPTSAIASTPKPFRSAQQAKQAQAKNRAKKRAFVSSGGPTDPKSDQEQANLEHLASRPHRMKVHLQRGIEAEMSWPAFHVEDDSWYFSGCTIPSVLRTISRPGNFLLQAIPHQAHAVLIKRVNENGVITHFMAYGPATLAFLSNLQHGDWKPCNQFRIIDQVYIG